MELPIRVLIADDHTLVRQGLTALLAQESDLRVIGEAASGRAAVDRTAELHPDVVLMDLVMPDGDGIGAIQDILAAQPEVRILVLTGFADDEYIFPAIKAGALGYLLKDTATQTLVQAIRQVANGDSSLHPLVARRILHELAHPAEVPPTQHLTERELDVLRLVAQGLSNREIAEHLVITEMTVRSHVSNILSKLHVVSRIQAALYALRTGLASLPEA